MDIAVIESEKESIPSRLETPIIDLEKRNKEIINAYNQGVIVSNIAKTYNVSQPRVYQIVQSNIGFTKDYKEQEKVRRLRRLKQVELKTPANLAPKNVSDLVNVIEAQRKELEGDNSATNNTQINISITSNEIIALPIAQKLEQIKKLLSE